MLRWRPAPTRSNGQSATTLVAGVVSVEMIAAPAVVEDRIPGMIEMIRMTITTTATPRTVVLRIIVARTKASLRPGHLKVNRLPTWSAT